MLMLARLLGQCEVRSRRGSIRLRRRESALVALACTGRAMELSRDALASMLWPSVPLPNAIHSLRQALHRLGRLVPGLKCQCHEGRPVVFLGSLASDLADFQSAVSAQDWQRATALYAGPFLGSFSLDEAPEFCQWADGVRCHLKRQALDAATHSLNAAEESGDWIAAESAARARLAAQPRG